MPSTFTGGQRRPAGNLGDGILLLPMTKAQSAKRGPWSFRGRGRGGVGFWCFRGALSIALQAKQRLCAMGALALYFTCDSGAYHIPTDRTLHARCLGCKAPATQPRTTGTVKHPHHALLHYSGPGLSAHVRTLALAHPPCRLSVRAYVFFTVKPSNSPPLLMYKSRASE